METKICSRCKEEKDLIYFRKDRRTKNGYGHYCLKCNVDVSADWHRNNREKVRGYKTKWRLSHKDQVKKIKRLGYLKKVSTPYGRLNMVIATSVYRSLKKNKNNEKWENILGYSVVKLKKHLEKQFIDGMSWENMGDWEIDHIIPISAHNFNSPDDIDFKKCWALKNLRPLWKMDNRRKHKKMMCDFQKSFSFSA